MIPKEIAAKIISRHIPIDVQLELTWRCNQRCRHCYQYEADGRELSTAQIKDIICQLAAAKTLYLAFTGGEPLLRRDFWEIAEFAAQKNFAMALQTNATLIGEQEAERIVELNFLVVLLTILGATAKTHDAITRTPGSFRKTLAAIRLLQKNNVRMVVNVPLMKDNFAEYHRIKEMQKKWGTEMDLRVSPYLFCKNDGSQGPAKLRLSNNEIRSYFLELKNQSDASPLNNRALICNFGTQGCTVNARGELYPCVAVPMVLGDLTKRRFADIWENNPVLTRIRRTYAEDLDDCRRCDLASSCFRCSGFSFTEKGDLFSCAQEPRRIAAIVKEVNEYEEAHV